MLRKSPAGSRLRAATCALVVAFLPSARGLRAASAATVHDKMGAGINYGEYFESAATCTRTDITVIPKAKFDTLYAAGFRHVRIPVRWGYRINKPWAASSTAPVTIHSGFLDRVQSTVDNALAAGLVVILNTHHEDWFQKSWSEDGEQVNKYIRLNTAGTDYYETTESNGGRRAMEVYKDIWKGIRDRFDGQTRYEDLIFEGLNEPRLEDGMGDFSNAEVNAVNQTVFNLLQDNLNQDKRRVYLMTVNNANNAKSFRYLTIPTRAGWTTADVRDQLIVTIHYYYDDTLTWTHGEVADPPDWGDAADYDDIVERFNDITPDSSAKFSNGSGALVGVRVNIGEFGIQHRKSDGGATNRDINDILEWYRAVAAAAQARGFSYTVWNDNGWFRVFNRDDGASGSFDWGSNYMSEIWKMVTLYKNRWRLTSGLDASFKLASSGGGWAAWEIRQDNAADLDQHFAFQVDPGAKLGQRDELRYPALRNQGSGMFLDVVNEGAPGNGNAIRNRGDTLDVLLDHYVSPDYKGSGAFSLAIPLPGPLYLGSSGAVRVIDVRGTVGTGTDAQLWQLESSNSQGWILEQAP